MIFGDDPYGTKRTCESIRAKTNDICRMLDGCSEYERTLRILGPDFYHGDATFREIMIKLEVMNHERNKPWWAR